MGQDYLKFKKQAIEIAKLSPCAKRKVGAIIVSKDGDVLSTGANYHQDGLDCEDVSGITYDEVIHAEVAAIQNLDNEANIDNATIFVTHKPCENCARCIADLNLKTVVVEDFMKFDVGKLQYSLIPPKAMKELAKALTYGAKKYKPNNWQLVDDPNRYIDSTMRHWEDWRAGDKIDNDSGLSNLSLAFVNIAFLIYFEDIK